MLQLLAEEEMDLWVILPTYNEAQNLERVVAAVRSHSAGVQVLVVDDASPDGTGEIAARLAAESSDVHVIRRVGERGLGTAYLAGFRRALEAGASAVLTMDCDFSHDPAAIPQLSEAVENSDLVIGSRYVAGGSIINWPPHRRAVSALANRFVRQLFQLPVRDCTSGFRLYRREVLCRIPWDSIRSSGYAFLVETLVWTSRQESVRILEVPICFTERVHGRSKLGAREAFFGALHLVGLRLRPQHPR